jgi:hypothetical protein
MSANLKNAVIYLPSGPDVQDRWEIIAASLRAAGVTDVRPAPMPAQSFQPRHARPQYVTSAEI